MPRTITPPPRGSLLASLGEVAVSSAPSARVEAIHNAAVGAALVHEVVSACAACAGSRAAALAGGLVRNARFVSSNSGCSALWNYGSSPVLTRTASAHKSRGIVQLEVSF